MQKATVATRYLPLENFHIVPIQEISLDGLKWSAKECLKKYRDREEIKLTTCQNAIVKKLGFEGGWKGFREDYMSDLNSFMIKNELTQPANLISPRFSIPVVSLNHRQCADRLFYSKQQLPRQIFTGYDTDWFAITNPFFSVKNPLQWRRDKKILLERLAKGERLSLDEVETPDLLVAAIESTRTSMMHWNNLLGSQFMRNAVGEWSPEDFESQIYFPSDYEGDSSSEFNDLLTSLKIFRRWTDTLESGWVDVVPYSNRLIFLKGKNGEYDFLFPTLRNSFFEHNVFEPYLKNSDIPKSNDTYHFKRWLYFEYDGWYEADQHVSEKSFYSNGGTLQDYPGSMEILRSNFIQDQRYTPPKMSARESEGFLPVTVNGETLFVSNLITVNDFRRFMAENPEYDRYRSQTNSEPWKTVNLVQDAFLPAAATWYDANAYATWIKRTKKLPVRLLSEEEYLSLAPLLSEDALPTEEEFLRCEPQELWSFYQPDGTPIAGFPSGLNSFDLQVGYIPEVIRWVENTNGLKFLDSHPFGEWLAPEAAAINCATHSSLCYMGVSPSRARFAAQSNGRYKFMKVGFRLCYLGES